MVNIIRRVRPSDGAASTFAWVGAFLFLVSLGYFLYAYLIAFAATSTDGALSRSLTWNVASFTIFAFHHSIFARTRARAWIARVFSRRLERSVYVWVASVFFIVVCATWQPVPGSAWSVTGPVRWVLAMVQLAAVWLMLRSASIIDVFELAGVRSPVSKSGAGNSLPPSEFKTAGPYAWVRHPIYSGWLLFVFAASPMTMTRLTFAVISSAYLIVAIPLEERSLRTTSAGAYEGYMTRVPWRLVPGVY
jgi:protein-S-isoprenylcysteine O-methyltransferase Ste14